MDTCVKIIGGCIGLIGQCIAVTGSPDYPCNAPSGTPSGMVTAYGVHFPVTINWGSSPTPIADSPSDPSTVVNQTDPNNWTARTDYPSAYIIAGWTATSNVMVTLSNTGDNTVFPGKPPPECGIWLVRYTWQSADLHLWEVFYAKRRAGPTINDVVGSDYHLQAMRYDGVDCPGAYADATISVSP